MAIVRDLSTKEKDPLMYNKGATLAGATVVKVTPRRVYLRNQGRLEYLALEATPITTPPPTQPKAGPPEVANTELDGDVRCSGGRCTLARKLVDKVLGNTAMLATSVRAMPVVKDGHAAGFKLDAI